MNSLSELRKAHVHLYGVMLDSHNGMLMTLRVFTDKEKAIEHATGFKTLAHVVELNPVEVNHV